MTTETKPTIRLCFSYPEPLKQQLIRLAKKDNRKLAGYITQILNKKVKQLKRSKNGKH